MLHIMVGLNIKFYRHLLPDCKIYKDAYMKKIILSLLSISCAYWASATYAGEMGPSNLTNQWTGYYLGLNAGGYWTNPTAEVTTAAVQEQSFLGFEPEITFNYALGAARTASGSLSLRTSGFIGGAQIGYNYQINPLLILGVETDIQGLGNSGKNNSINQNQPFSIFLPPEFFNVQTNIEVFQQTNYIGTLRGRLGLLVPRVNSLLLYFTGGLAYGEVQSSTTINGMLNPTVFGPALYSGFSSYGRKQNTQAGFTVGGGLEKFVSSRWSVKVEYLYYDLGTLNYSNGFAAVTETVPFGPPEPAPAFALHSTTNVSFTGSIVRGGVNVKFA